MSVASAVTLFLLLVVVMFVSACTEPPAAVAARDAIAFTFNGSVADRCDRDVKHVAEAGVENKRPELLRRVGMKATAKAVGSASIEGDKATVSIELTAPPIRSLAPGPDFERELELPAQPSVHAVTLERENGRWVVCGEVAAKARDRLEQKAASEGIVLVGATLDEKRASLCRQLTALLPLRGRARDLRLEMNALEFGCDRNPPRSLPPTGYWSVRNEIRQIDNSVDTFATLDEGRGDDVSERLILRCSGGIFEAFFATKDYVSEDQNIRIRVDDSEAAPWWASKGTGGSALFFSKPSAFVAKIKNAKRLIVEYKPYSKSATEAVYDTAGLDEVLKKFPETCVAAPADKCRQYFTKTKAGCVKIKPVEGGTQELWWDDSTIAAIRKFDDDGELVAERCFSRVGIAVSVCPDLTPVR